jgi:hypothetical protein
MAMKSAGSQQCLITRNDPEEQKETPQEAERKLKLIKVCVILNTFLLVFGGAR